MNNSKLCLFLLFAAFSVTSTFGADWKAAAALENRPGTESVKVRQTESSESAIRLQYTIPAATVKSNNGSSVTLQTGNSLNHALEGEPILPVIPVKVIIPYGKSIDNISINTKVKSVLQGKYDIAYQEAYSPLYDGAKKRTVQAKASIYQSNNRFPGQPWQLVSVQKLNGVSIAFINISPVMYFPLSKGITSITNLELVISLKQDKLTTSKTPLFPERIDAGAMGIENPEALDTYKSVKTSTGFQKLGICNAGDYSYVAVTSKAIRDAATDYSIRDLVARRLSQGFTATIVTIDTILTEYTGVDNAEKLRNFIIDAYANWGTRYVLLGGDISVVPMRKLYQTLEGGETIPSDLYFQCLDGNYNYDNDSQWGEATDGLNGGEVDLMAEVLIGRASAETAAEMSNFVYKTLKYETENDAAAYLHKALMCGEYLGFGGVSDYATGSMEEVRNGSSANGYTTSGFAACATMTTDALYDSVNYEWPKSEIVSKINSNQYSIINHLGHANYNYVMKFYNSDADLFTNTNPIFLLSQGCIPGNFEEDCIAEHMTTSNRSGLWGGVMNSRYGWGSRNSTNGPSQLFDRQFWDAYFGEDKNLVGDLNADSHQDNINTINDPYTRWCMYETNLFGDPCTIMRGKISGPMVQFASFTADDHLGNNDKIVNPGETIELPITLVNNGSDQATNVSATISTTDSYVSVTRSSSGFGNISCCGAHAVSQAAYVVQVSSSCPTPRVVTFSMQITDGTHTWNSNFQMNVYTSNTISGTVKTFTGNTPLAGAIVKINGTSNDTVITDASGHFTKNVISGTYSVFANAAGYLSSDTQRITLPPNSTALSFLMKRPILNLSKTAVNANLTSGSTGRDTITVYNSGDARLDYSVLLKETTGFNLVQAVRTYDASHFVNFEKGETDTRIGDPVRTSSGGPDAFGYSWRDSKSAGGPAFVWDDISSTGTLLSSVSSCDDCYQAQALSFTFNYYGVDYNSIYVSSNGFITLGSGNSSFSNYPIPSGEAPSAIIAGYWDDLYPGSGGSIYFKDYGNRAVIQFTNVPTYSGSTSLTFQIVIDSDGSINFYYNNFTGSANLATIGMQDTSRTIGLSIAYNTNYIEPGLAVEIRNAPEWVTVAPENDTCSPSQRKNLVLSFNATGLSNGTYTANMIMNHNDPVALNPAIIPITLTVGSTTLPVITRQPEDATVRSGQTATFSVTASGSGLNYQWFKNGSSISGANSNSYTTPATTSADSNSAFYCAVSNSAGSVSSSVAHLYVTSAPVDPPTILTQPASITVYEGSNATFSIVASGIGISYQWYRNDTLITGATGSSYVFAAAPISFNGSAFKCVVTNAGGSVSSLPATLSVLALRPIQLQVLSIGTSASSVLRGSGITAENVIIGSSVNGVVEGNRFRLFLK